MLARNRDGQMRLVRLLGALLIPLLVAASIIGATWKFGDRLNRVEAAIVNEDQMIEIDGQKVPLGRQLAANLTELKGENGNQPNVSWQLMNADGARDGLKSGRFAAVVTIPKEFTTQAMSFATGIDPRQASVKVERSDVNSSIDPSLAQVIISQATSALNKTLTEQFAAKVFEKTEESAKQMGKLADGATQLADGNKKIADGIAQSKDGTDKYVDGVGQTAGGAAKLNSGVTKYTQGVDQAAGGASELSSGVTRYTNGVDQIASRAPELSSGVTRYTNGVDQLVGGSSELQSGMTQYVGGVNQLSSGVMSLAPGVLAYVDGSQQLAGGAGALSDGVTQYVQGGKNLAAAAKQVSDGWAQFNQGLIAYDGMLQSLATQAGATKAANDHGVVATTLPTATQLATQQESDVVTQVLTGIANAPVPPEVATQITQAIDTCVSSIMTAAPTFNQITATSICRTAVTAGAESGKSQLPTLVASSVHAGSTMGTTVGVNVSVPAGIITGANIAHGGLIYQPSPTSSSLLEASAQLSSGTKQVSDGLAAMSAAGGQLQTGAQKLAAGSQQLVSRAPQLQAGTVQLAVGAGATAAGGDRVLGGTNKIASGLGEASASSSQLRGGVSKLADGLSQASASSSQLRGGVSKLADGLDQASAGSSQLRDGAGQLSAGLDQLSTRGSELTGGLGQLQSGADKAAAGTSEMANGIKDGLKQVPSYTAEQRTSMAQVASEPIKQQAFTSVVDANKVWPLAWLVVALWLGALALFTAFLPLDRRMALANKTTGRQLLQTILPPVGFAVAQAVVLAIMGQAFLHLSWGKFFAVAAVLAFGGMVFAVVNHALAAWLGGIGRAISIGMVALSLATIVTNAAPGVFTTLASLSPVTPAIHAVKMIAGGGVGATGDILALVGWLLFGLVASIAAVLKARTMSVKNLVAASTPAV